MNNLEKGRFVPLYWVKGADGILRDGARRVEQGGVEAEMTAKEWHTATAALLRKWFPPQGFPPALPHKHVLNQCGVKAARWSTGLPAKPSCPLSHPTPQSHSLRCFYTTEKSPWPEVRSISRDSGQLPQHPRQLAACLPPREWGHFFFCNVISWLERKC